nr:inorganic diphosphatase [Candidatus Gracilibacteria bacterium]
MSNLKKYLGKVLKVKIDRPLGTRHPEYGFIYPINYGYIPNTISGDGQEIDAYILGIYNPVNEFEGKCIAIIKRLNDNEDKLIIAPENFSFTNQQIISLTEFQEKFFDIKLIR